MAPVAGRSPAAALVAIVALSGSLGLASVAIAAAPSGVQGPAVADGSAAAQSDLDALARDKGGEPVGSYLAEKIAILTAHGQTLDGFVMEIANPDGRVYKISYSQNHGEIGAYARTWHANGAASDALQNRSDFATPRSGKLDPSDARLSDPPNADLINAINAIDADHRAQLDKMAPKSAADPLTSLGIVKVANAATEYDGQQHREDLSPGFLVSRWGTGNHSMTLNTWGYWYGGLCGCADPGDEDDAMDAEWDPSDMYMTNVTWTPSGTFTAGPFGWHGTHNIAMTSTTNHAQLGGDYQKPDKNSKYNDLYVYLAPKAPSVYGRGFNAYGNYIHNWNFWMFSGITYALTYGHFTISTEPLFTGSWDYNFYRALTI